MNEEIKLLLVKIEEENRKIIKELHSMKSQIKRMYKYTFDEYDYECEE